MFRSRFLWKLFAAFALVVLVTSIAIGWIAHGPLEERLIEREERALRHQSLLLVPFAEEVLAGSRARAAADMARMGAETGLRVTIIDASGAVLADSDEDPAIMENHHGRPEVKDAFATGSGIARRFSKTVGDRRLYVATAVRREDDVRGVVRVSIRLAEVEQQLASMRARMLLGAGIGSLVAIALGLFIAQRITAPITRMIRTADELREGSFAARVKDLPRDEIGVLGDALNRLGEEITRRIARLSSDEAQLRAMLAGMVEGVVAVDDGDRVVFSNEAARALLGLGSGDIRRERIWELARSADLDELIVEARATGGTARCELRAVSEGGASLLEAYAHPFGAQSASGVVVVLHDVTELRRLEQVRRDFVSNVSHELKTPLTSIRGYVETLLSGALYDETNNKRFLEKIDKNVGRLNHLVADLLSLARIEDRDGVLPMEPVDWKPILEQALGAHDAAAREKQLECVIEAPDVPLQVLGDPEAMTQVIDNLLGNAIKYTPQHGKVSLRITRDGGWGVLEVADTGVGIPAEDLERIFERFYRVDKARSRDLGGTGLGLSIVKNVVQSMQGEVSVESQLGGGTRFRVRLPLVAPHGA